VLQNLKPWMPAPPRLRSLDEPAVVEPVAPSLVSTAISSQDGPQVEDSKGPAPRGGDGQVTVSAE